MIGTILMVFAFVLFAIAAIWNPPPEQRWGGRLVAAGLACWSLSIIFGGFAGFGFRR